MGNSHPLLSAVGRLHFSVLRAQKKPRFRGASVSGENALLPVLRGADVCRLEALRSLHHVESNSLSLGESAKALNLDLTEVDEEILPLRLLNESVPLFGTKPLDSPLSQT